MTFAFDSFANFWTSYYSSFILQFTFSSISPHDYIKHTFKYKSSTCFLCLFFCSNYHAWMKWLWYIWPKTLNWNICPKNRRFDGKMPINHPSEISWRAESPSLVWRTINHFHTGLDKKHRDYTNLFFVTTVAEIFGAACASFRYIRPRMRDMSSCHLLFNF